MRVAGQGRGEGEYRLRHCRRAELAPREKILHFHAIVIVKGARSLTPATPGRLYPLRQFLTSDRISNSRRVERGAKVD
jgi:hypothetical protein